MSLNTPDEFSSPEYDANGLKNTPFSALPPGAEFLQDTPLNSSEDESSNDNIFLTSERKESPKPRLSPVPFPDLQIQAAELETSRIIVKELKQKLSNFEEEKAKLEAFYTEQKRELTTIQNLNAQLQQKLAESQAITTNLTHEKEELQRETARLTEEIATLQQQVQEIEKKQQEESTTATEKTSQLTIELEVQKKKNSTQLQKMEETMQANEQLKQENSTILQHTQEMGKKLREELATAASEMAALQEEKTQLQNTAADLGNELQSTEQNLLDLPEPLEPAFSLEVFMNMLDKCPDKNKKLYLAADAIKQEIVKAKTLPNSKEYHANFDRVNILVENLIKNQYESERAQEKSNDISELKQLADKMPGNVSWGAFIGGLMKIFLGVLLAPVGVGILLIKSGFFALKRKDLSDAVYNFATEKCSNTKT